VTGGAGLLGSHVVCTLRDKRCAAVFAPPRSDFDSREMSR
jgi:nucleoside-diphosphate-sugar epimerase